MAEAENVLRELSLDARMPHPIRRSNTRPQALPAVSRLRLDLNLDFVVHEDGVIELTEAGFRRIVQAHSARA
jgi:hypothetical protein